MNLDFNIIPQYASYLVSATGITIKVTLLALFFGFLLAIPRAFMKLSRFRVLRIITSFYTAVFRGVPLLVQLMLVYFGVPQLTGGNLTPLQASTIALSLNSAAYLSETLRGGIMAVDYGQREAALALGVSSPWVMIDIVMPQALKSVLPGLVNEMINLLKNTSLVSCISMVDLLRAAQLIISRSYRAFEPLLTVAIIYFILVEILDLVSRRLERWVNKSDRR